MEALVAIFGTTNSPYLFVWQAGEEIRAPYVSAILNGLAAPPLILLMLTLSNWSNGQLEGGRLSRVLMAVALVVMSASAAVYLIGSIVG
jgi:hypothetical protein